MKILTLNSVSFSILEANHQFGLITCTVLGKSAYLGFLMDEYSESRKLTLTLQRDWKQLLDADTSDTTEITAIKMAVAASDISIDVLACDVDEKASHYAADNAVTYPVAVRAVLANLPEHHGTLYRIASLMLKYINAPSFNFTQLSSLEKEAILFNGLMSLGTRQPGCFREHVEIDEAWFAKMEARVGANAITADVRRTLYNE